MNPSANWDDWPSTRTGAIAIIALFFSYVIFLHILTFVKKRQIIVLSKEQTNNNNNNVVMIKPIIWYRWKLIPWKFVTMTITTTTETKDDDEEGNTNNNDQDSSISITIQEKTIICCCGCCPPKSYHEFQMIDIRKKREGLSCSSIGTSIIAGFIMGMMIHFIPCIWWTCDWGDSDNEGMRGSIWFISGITFGVWCILMDALEYKHILVSNQNCITINGYYNPTDMHKK